jgi:hypothetical protein
VFGGCDWAVLFVRAREGKTYACLRFNVGPGGELFVPVWTDYSRPFGPADHQAWAQEYADHIRAAPVEWIDRCLSNWDTHFTDRVEDGLLTEAEKNDILSEDEDVLYEYA